MTADAVVDLLVRVGREVHLRWFGHLDAAQIGAKAHGEVVTEADREAEAMLSDALQSMFPGALATGEESIAADPSLLDALPTAEHLFVIDPIDGTANFVAGNPDFGILLAEVRAGVTTRAWIWQPVHHLLVTGDRATGEVRVDGELAAPVGAGTGARTGAGRALFGGAAHPFLDIGGPGLEVAPMLQSCAVDYPQMVTGQRDFLVHNGDRPWDHLPGTLQVELLGGRVAYVDGTPYSLSARGSLPLVAARTPQIWDTVTRAVRARH